MEEEKKIEGFLLINKPNGMTSFNCVSRIKYYLPRKTKVGHAGTLDSFATGLLIIAIGRPATREIPKLMNLDKWYTATGKLGQWTDTLDFTGQTFEDKPVTITKEQLEQAIASFGLSYAQTPPIYSALKYKGRRLSDLARKHKLPEEELDKIAKAKTKEVRLYHLSLEKYEPPFFTIKAHVSHGTYIRALIEDIAKKVGSHATTHELDRSKIGPFSIDQAVDLSTLENLEEVEEHLFSIEKVLKQLNEYTIP